jgi:AraC-like DNA-binding protein
MSAELQQISFDDSGGFKAAYINGNHSFWHFHPEFELVLNLKSNGTRIIGDSVELFDKYDMVLMAGNIPHCWNYYTVKSSLPDKHGMFLHFKFSSLGEPLMSQYEMQPFRELLLSAERGISFAQEDAEEAEFYLDQMINERGIDKMISFFSLIRILVHSRKRNYICSENYRLEYDERGNKRMADVYTYIKENYFKPVSLRKISCIAKMNPVAFSRYFKENCGTGFVEYLNRTRTNKACYLLKETNYQVHEIAIECGFGSISNFNKQFRKEQGVSPKVYRDRYK